MANTPEGEPPHVSRSQDTEQDPKIHTQPTNDVIWWNGKLVGQEDDAGRKIEEIYINQPTLFVYIAQSELYYDGTSAVMGKIRELTIASAKIRALSPESLRERKRTIYEQLSKAIYLIANNNKETADWILKDVLDQLTTAKTSVQRLIYLWSAISASFSVWVAFLVWFLWDHQTHYLLPWLLALAMGSTGGVLSVCANHDSITINLRESKSKYFWAGVTRIILALICGLGVLLAIRAGIILRLVEGKQTSEAVPLVLASEMFFCFVGGFSEAFLPNVLRQHSGTPNSSHRSNKENKGKSE